MESTRPNPQHSSHQISYTIKLLANYEIRGFHTSDNFHPPLSNLKAYVSQSIGNQLQNYSTLNPLNPELNPICYLLALLAHHFLHVSRIRVKSLTLRLLLSYIYIYIYIYMERLFLMFLDHTRRRSTVGRTVDE